MKKIDFNIKLDSNEDFLEVFILGDTHIGSPDFDEKTFLDYYEGLLHNKRMYVIGIGDYMEVVTSSARTRFAAQQTMPIHEQKVEIMNYLQPIAEEGRVITLLQGNHEQRLSLREDYDVTADLCRELDVDYSNDLAIIHLNIKKGRQTTKYIISCEHGTGWSRTVGGRANTIKRMEEIVHSDCYVIGHLHNKMFYKLGILDNETLETREVGFGMTGAYLKYGGYTLRKMYRPPSRGSLKLKFHADMDRISGR